MAFRIEFTIIYISMLLPGISKYICHVQQRPEMKFTIKDIFNKEKELEEVQDELGTSVSLDATVLVVDDSKTVLLSVDKLLRSVGFKTLTAASAKEGIELAKTLKPDLILMDIVMPEINGFQATRMLRKLDETKSIPIIIISGNKMQTEQLWGQRLGANGFLPKPINKRAFLELAKSLLDLHQFG